MRTLIIIISLFASIVASGQSSMLLKPEYKRFKALPGVTIDYHAKYVIVENEPLVIAKKVYLRAKPIIKEIPVIQYRQDVQFINPKLSGLNYSPVSKTELAPAEKSIPELNYKTVTTQKKGYGLFFGGVAAQLTGTFILISNYKPLTVRNKIDITSTNVYVNNKITGGGCDPWAIATGSVLIGAGYFIEKTGFKHLGWDNGVLTFIF
jgi:hypothetical protein